MECYRRDRSPISLEDMNQESSRRWPRGWSSIYKSLVRADVVIVLVECSDGEEVERERSGV